MSKIEKILITVLTITALGGVVFSYYAKASRDKIEIMSLGEAGETKKAECAIGQRLIIDINNADRDTLTKIPGIGPKLAQNIVDYRRENGIFESTDEIMNVKGIGPKKYKSLKEYIRVDV
jgi:comEA protein